MDNKKWTDVNYKFCEQKDKEEVEEHMIQKETSWEDVDFDQIRSHYAEKMIAAETDMLTDEDRQKYEDNAMDFWDKFYRRNQDKFFKDRTYLHLEYPELNPLNIDRDQTAHFFTYMNSQNPNYNNNNNNNNKNNGDGANEETTTTTTAETTESTESTLPNESINKWWENIQELNKETSQKVVMEVGCGVGNSVFPLLKLNPEKYFYAFDFSPHAVNIVKSHPLYNEDRVTAFVCDIATEPLPENIKENSVDIILLIFVLSAISYDKMNQVLTTLYKSLKPGGIIYVRDYGLYDMTQLRFLSKKGRKIDQNFYLRSDGTRTYFFTTETLSELFNEAGFNTLVAKYDTRELRNRKKMISMYRVWVRGKYQKPLLNQIENTTATTTTENTTTTTTTSQ